ncbi:MAG: hypothetical protein MMC33_008491 [Icmadophila ericetorum]|nr:hypothetical protein [Icmadophila ericetorum]
MALPNTAALLALGISLTVTYWVALIVQRLFYSRISHIPGPKLAAASTLYQAYYDFFPHRGRFLWKCIDLHKKYGPIIRIGPDEVHVDDPSFYSEMYSSATHRRNKSALWYWMDGTGEFGDLSAFMTMDHNLHRMRRSGLGTYFSKRMVNELEPRIRDKVLLLRKRMLERAATREPVDLKDAYGAMTLDVISMYCFGQSIGSLDDAQLGKRWNDLMGSGVRLQPFLRSFPNIARLVLALPKQVTNLVPLYREATDFIGTAAALTRTAMDEAIHDTSKWPRLEEVPQTTVLHSIIQSDTLPEHEKTFRRLAADAATMLAGGMDTTSRALSVTTYHLLKNEHMRKRVMQELRSIMPTPQSPLPRVVELEKLPYLTAAIYEGLRISHGVAGRLVRIAPDEDLDYTSSDGKTYRIPRGATFSQSGYLIHTNETIYPNPDTFDPERFYKTDGGMTDAQRNLVSFGKGTRACPGINLAWAEMYLAVAAVFGSLSMAIDRTTDKDVMIDSEFFVGALPDGPGISIKVLGELKE